ncbi:hypothetical protein HMPREF1551_00558 [Capnocytophaga sp. oral taxon 863 str. F0517]|uniref:hypothetical protein n=1 Tax=Capnocytophaga sp. oral taxon 863 TaxID=1227265 RepID=UPI0003966635|nr:hypothetical protein [Capnocytophaga sp. oral taxon 863]ERI64319.1 hypothetical protein HMPREF1551_00558 [Capnocytophaga sp. oral taxon 863 str. F0517]
MKTVFRKGMKVYDQIYEPDVKGEVLDVNLDISPHPITVKFGSCVRYYTAEGCRGRNQIRTLSTSPYRIEGFEQKAPVPTFEEALDWLKSNKYYNTLIRDDKTYTSTEMYIALEALRKLVILRDYYNDGWKPDWKDDSTTKSVILIVNEEIRCDENYSSKRTLAFKSKEIRNRFFEEQKELLEMAKPLL